MKIMTRLLKKSILGYHQTQEANKDNSRAYYKHMRNNEENKKGAYISRAVNNIVRTEVDLTTAKDIYSCEIDISASIDNPVHKYKRLYRDSSYSTMQKSTIASKSNYISPSPKKSVKAQSNTSI
jgi:hypothetical protein